MHTNFKKDQYHIDLLNSQYVIVTDDTICQEQIGRSATSISRQIYKTMRSVPRGILQQIRTRSALGNISQISKDRSSTPNVQSRNSYPISISIETVSSSGLRREELVMGGENMRTMQYLQYGEKDDYTLLRSSFRLNRTKKAAVAYLKQLGKEDQIAKIPDEYPTRQGQLSDLDLVIRGNILRSHLTDLFENVRVGTLRRTTPHTIIVRHDLTDDSVLQEICKLYKDSDLRIKITRISQQEFW